MKKILLLDDNLDIVQVVEEVLSYEEYHVHSTMKSIDFLSLVDSLKPDLILMDYRLPDGNGGELCRTIKADPKYSNIPVIIFSAYTHPDLDMFTFGCDEVIAKPFDLECLINAVRSLTADSLKSA